MSDKRMREDEHGQYDPDAGSPHPVDPGEVNYDPCNAVLKYTFERYGERRYCTGMAVSNFTRHDVDTDYEHPEFCKHHQCRAALMKQHEENFKTGAHAKSHDHIFQHLPPHKQLLANDLYKSLVDESKYDFDTEDVELEIDVSDKDFGGPEVDTIVLDHPIPQDKEIRCKALWFAALDFMSMESIREEQFRVAAEDDHEGRELAVGERTTYVATDDDFKEVVEEHHLNLPLSRIQKDYKNHLEFGGVSRETEDDTSSLGGRNWEVEIVPNEDDVAPESKTADSSPLTEIETPDEE